MIVIDHKERLRAATPIRIDVGDGSGAKRLAKKFRALGARVDVVETPAMFGTPPIWSVYTDAARAAVDAAVKDVENV